MGVWLPFFILILETIVLIIFDKSIHKTWITPVSIVAFPYLFVVAFAIFLGPRLGFVPIYPYSLVVWIAGLFLFWFGGLAVSILFPNMVSKFFCVNMPVKYETRSRKVVLIMAWLGIVILGYYLMANLKNIGWSNFGSDVWNKSYGGGISGHVRVFLMPLWVFLFGTLTKGDRIGKLTLGVLLILFFSYPVKSWIIVPILAGFFYKHTKTKINKIKSNVNIKSLLYIVVLGIMVFYLVYLLEFSSKNRNILLLDFDSKRPKTGVRVAKKPMVTRF